MAKDRKLIQLEEASKTKFAELRKRFETKKLQPPSFAALANRAIRKGLSALTEEVLAELK